MTDTLITRGSGEAQPVLIYRSTPPLLLHQTNNNNTQLSCSCPRGVHENTKNPSSSPHAKFISPNPNPNQPRQAHGNHASKPRNPSRPQLTKHYITSCCALTTAVAWIAFYSDLPQDSSHDNEFYVHSTAHSSVES
jgi:hypothetical protein